MIQKVIYPNNRLFNYTKKNIDVIFRIWHSDSFWVTVKRSNELGGVEVERGRNTNETVKQMVNLIISDCCPFIYINESFVSLMHVNKVV